MPTPATKEFSRDRSAGRKANGRWRAARKSARPANVTGPVPSPVSAGGSPALRAPAVARSLSAPCIAIVLVSLTVGLIYVALTIHLAATNYEIDGLIAERDDLARQVQTLETGVLRWGTEATVHRASAADRARSARNQDSIASPLTDARSDR